MSIFMVIFAFLLWILSAEIRVKFQFKSSLTNTVWLFFHIYYVIVARMQFLWCENEQATIKIILKDSPMNSIFSVIVDQLWSLFSSIDKKNMYIKLKKKPK